MSRARRLQPARDVAEQRERDAAVELARARQTLAELQRQVDELNRFRIEYAERLCTRPGGELQSALLLKDGHCFLARLDIGIEQAERQLVEQRRLCEARQTQWIACRVRTRAIGKLAERHLARESRVEARIEQRDQDEVAARRDR